MKQTQTNKVIYDQQKVLNLSEAADQVPWMALHLFSLRQDEVRDCLVEKGLEVYVPLEWVDIEDAPHHRKRVLKPVVRNLLFVKATLDDVDMAKTISDIPFPVRVLRYSPQDPRPAKIPARQMFQFQAMCNPDIMRKQYLSEEEAKLKKGCKVVVTHGPLKGLTGRLVRSSKQYYLLNEVPGIAVMMNVARWCCEPVEE